MHNNEKSDGRTEISHYKTTNTDGRLPQKYICSQPASPKLAMRKHAGKNSKPGLFLKFQIHKQFKSKDTASKETSLFIEEVNLQLPRDTVSKGN